MSLYARGLSKRDIQAELKELYQVNVSPTLISEVTDAVLSEVKGWQQQPIDALYPVVYLDCIFVKLRVEGIVRTQAVYLAIAINLQGLKEVLGMWIGKDQKEGAKFWLSVLNELKQRGLDDVSIFCVDGLKGFPEATLTGLSAFLGTALYCSSDPQQPNVRALGQAQSCSSRPQNDLHRSQ